MARKKRLNGEAITIKKYANRRLYNTETSSYVTLDHLAEMIKAGEELIVLDAKSGEDLTRAVLTQIIVEKETNEENMLPVSFLRQLIRFYGDSMQSLVPTYLQNTMDILNKHQKQIKLTFGDSGNGNMMPLFEEMTRQNMAFFEQSMHMFMQAGATSDKKQDNEPSAEANDNSDIADLQAQLKALQEKVDKISS